MSLLRTITLPNSDISTTTIGFGCNALLGASNTRRDALKLLETAFDLGIRHFDVARSYEAGDSEEILGEFARRKRDQITITTKFRINHSGQYIAESPTKAWLRRHSRDFLPLQQARPLLKKIMGKGEHAPSASSMAAIAPPPEPIQEAVDVNLVRQSLEISLRELKTDHIDLYFIHEGTVADTRSDELFHFLNEAKAGGKIRQFGVGATFERVKAICQQTPDFVPVVQFESSLLKPQVGKIDSLGKRGIITHGALASLSSVADRLSRIDPTALHLPDRETSTLASFLLQFALRENPEGIVLFRSSKPRNIVENLRFLNRGEFPDEAFEAIWHMIAQTDTHTNTL